MIMMKLLFMNKILQIWKMFFTETNSHHILSKYLNLLYIWAICQKTNITFLYSCAKPCKDNDFYYVFIRNFVPKNIYFEWLRNFVPKNIYFEWLRNFVQTWFRMDKKMMQNFVQNAKLMRKFQLRFSTKISELLFYAAREMEKSL